MTEQDKTLEQKAKTRNVWQMITEGRDPMVKARLDFIKEGDILVFPNGQKILVEVGWAAKRVDYFTTIEKDPIGTGRVYRRYWSPYWAGKEFPYLYNKFCIPAENSEDNRAGMVKLQGAGL